MSELMDGRQFLELAKNGCANLKANIKTVNELNVFPVPDGDTGTNMIMTLETAENQINDITSIGVATSQLANRMMYSARGNSGVILSQYFKGLAKGFEGLEKSDVKQFANALITASDTAYSAVNNPVEGTILTVARESAVYANEIADTIKTFKDLFLVIYDKSHSALMKTPELLPILKEAGVVDSGGAGLFYIFQGMFKYLSGERVYSDDKSEDLVSKPDYSSFNENSTLEYGYCTEMILQLLNSKTERANFDISAMRDYLNTLGDSVDLFAEGTVIKIHIHTFTPGKVIEYCQRFGEFATFKLENMTIQHSETVIANNFNEQSPVEKKKYAFVSVATGDGMESLFKEIGCDEIIRGGQTMNPSANDFIDAFGNINAEYIIVLPNNSNVIMAAVQASECYDKADVRVLRVSSMCQGYSALAMADTSCDNIDDLLDGMKQAADNVISASVTQAIRDSEYEGIKISKDDYIAVSNHKVYASEKSPEGAVISLIDSILKDSEKDVLTIFTGSNANSESTEAIQKYVEENYKSIDFGVVYGGQEVYDYMVSAE